MGDGVILGAQARLGEFDRVSKRKDEGDEDEEDEEDDEDEEDEDSELEDAESRKSYSYTNLLILLRLEFIVVIVDQGPITAILGEGSNAIVWPKGAREDEEDLDEVERFNNLRLMRIGTSRTEFLFHSHVTYRNRLPRFYFLFLSRNYISRRPRNRPAPPTRRHRL